MNPGDVVLIRLPQTGPGPQKLRPALLLAKLKGPYQNLLICGISTQLHLLEPAWDELLDPADADYATSGVRRSSAIRLSFLHAAERSEIAGRIGSIDLARLARLRSRLAAALA